MAYGDESVTLANFDRIIPDKVFQEVTSITLEQFRFLRDGGPYINQATGQEEHFAGHLFDPVVFDDSVKEFLNLKVKLADYFDESRTEENLRLHPAPENQPDLHPQVGGEKDGGSAGAGKPRLFR